MEPFGKSAKIVIVDDNVALADIYRTRMEILGYQCFVAYDGVEALALIEKELPDLVLLDLMVPKIAGDQILQTMRKSDWGKHIKVMIISNLNEADAPPGLREQGIEGYAVKANLSNDQLDVLVDAILKPADQEEDTSLELPAAAAPAPTPSPMTTVVEQMPLASPPPEPVAPITHTLPVQDLLPPTSQPLDEGAADNA
ncbi:MAG: Two component transcriptional regulator, winged helix [Candidatus Saccharibacteria bacterium]|nr:Two component transcriptional regulator, winged helix [Candidatus Saccharibacteria bacterium]